MSKSDKIKLITGSTSKELVNQTLANTTFVGIDFGTSTTVVSVIKKDQNGNLTPVALQLPQPDGRGGFSEQEIVNSVLAWIKSPTGGNQLLFGKTAYELKAQLKPERNVFSSFKMALGLDIGPSYPDTYLSHRNGSSIVIETAKDATSYFFLLLKQAIDRTIEKENLPTHIEYAVSVPASFLTNQRKDLIDALHKAGISVSENCLIDEPNAAFLSYFYTNVAEQNNSNFLDDLKKHELNILVYDFGAGTCDISILKVYITEDCLKSKNIAISKFTALGGDNLDRDIATLVLAKKLSIDSKDPTFSISESAKQTITARLMPLAEDLKISMVKWLITQGITSYDSLSSVSHVIQLGSKTIFRSAKGCVEISVAPSLSVQEFRTVLSRYLDDEDYINNPTNICAPIEDAMNKSGLKPKDIYGVLFIGGSSENPLIRSRIMDYFPDSVKAIIPSDLRTHVSKGAAIHSVGYHGFKRDFIIPIISENIYVITSGNNLQCLIKASTPVPSEVFKLQLHPQRDGQKNIEIPISLSSSEQLLGILKFHAQNKTGFKASQVILVSGAITRDKTIEVRAMVDGKEICTDIFNPLSISQNNINKDYLVALKQYRIERLEYGAKNISAHTIQEVIKAAINANMHREATEHLIELETLYNEYKTSSNATNILYHASRCGKDNINKKYTKIAVEREENECTCYNYSLDCIGEEKIKWLRKSLNHDPNYVASLINLGHILLNKKNLEGKKLLDKAFELLKIDFESQTISNDDLRRYSNLCSFLNKAEELNKINSYKNSKMFIERYRLNEKKYNDESLTIIENDGRYIFSNK